MSRYAISMLEAGFFLEKMKSLKTARGITYHFTLTHNRVPVAFVEDHGDGGLIDVTWQPDTTSAQAQFFAVAVAVDLEEDAELLLADLADLADSLKRGEQKTFFLLEDALYHVRIPYTPAVATALREKYPGCVVVSELIANIPTAN